MVLKPICRSVVELVSWFSRNSLKEAFSGLDATLRFSVGELSLVEAAFDFDGGGGGGGGGDKGNMLPLKGPFIYDVRKTFAIFKPPLPNVPIVTVTLTKPISTFVCFWGNPSPHADVICDCPPRPATW